MEEVDLVVLGTGVSPNVNLVSRDLHLSKNKGIEVNAFLKTSRPNVFAAGDVASFPYWYNGGDNVRVEHYNTAIK